jgi:hypothetical protein
MIEDPLYLNKDIKVFMVADFNLEYDVTIANEAIKSWNVFGYDIIKYNISDLDTAKYDFKLNFSEDYTKRKYAVNQAYAVVAILKKMRNQSEKFIILNNEAIMKKDLPKEIEKYSFFPFYGRDGLYGKLNSIFFDQYSSHVLYKDFVDINLIVKGTIFHNISLMVNERRLANKIQFKIPSENELVSINESL